MIDNAILSVPHRAILGNAYHLPSHNFAKLHPSFKCDTDMSTKKPLLFSGYFITYFSAHFHSDLGKINQMQTPTIFIHSSDFSETQMEDPSLGCEYETLLPHLHIKLPRMDTSLPLCIKFGLMWFSIH